MQVLNQPHPITKPFDEGYLPEKNGHKVWFCQAGRPDGLPVVMIHGGPGYYSRPETREIFDPHTYRIIQFDQRGGGKSEVKELLQANTTQDLLNDIERLLAYLKIDQIVLFGSSWGSTLALLYAQQHPDKIRALLIKSVFLARESDLTWSESALAKFLPEIDVKIKIYKRQYQLNDYFAVCAHLLAQLQSGIPDKQTEALELLETWESNLSGIDRRIVTESSIELEPNLIASYQVMLHYMLNKCFLSEDHVLSNLDRIRQIPTQIVHGRYDILSPIASAFAVADKLDQVELTAVLDAGHSGSSRLVEACQLASDKIAHQLD